MTKYNETILKYIYYSLLKYILIYLGINIILNPQKNRVI